MICGSQFKVTTDDVITVRNTFYPTIGDKIRLEKVLLVGGRDFTIIGKPLIRFEKLFCLFVNTYNLIVLMLIKPIDSKSFVHIDATVIEKTLTNDVVRYTYKARKNNGRWGCKCDLVALKSFT